MLLSQFKCETAYSQEIMILFPLNWQLVNSNQLVQSSHQLAHLSDCIYRLKSGCDEGTLIFVQEHSSNADATINPSGSKSPPVLGLVAIGTDK